MPVKVLLQEIRKSKGLSQNDLARRTGMSPQNIQKIEQGEAKSLTFRTLGLFCQALNCQPGDILVYENDPEDTSPDMTNPTREIQKSKFFSEREKGNSQRKALSPLRTVYFDIELSRHNSA